MQSLLPGSQLSEVAEFKLAAGKLGEKGPGVRSSPPKSPRNQGSGAGHWLPTGGWWGDTGEGLRVAPRSTQQRNPSDRRLGAGGPLLPGWQRLTWHLVPAGWQVLLSPVTAPGKKSVRGDQHHSASGQVSPAGGHGPQGGLGGVGPGGRPSTSGPAGLRRPLPGAAASSGRCQAALSEVAAWRAGGLACRGRAYSSPHPQEVTSSHSLQGGVEHGARILGSGRRMESPALRGGASGGGGLGPREAGASSCLSGTRGWPRRQLRFEGTGGRGGRGWDAVGGGRAGEDGAANSWDGSRQPLLDARWPPKGEEPRGAGPRGSLTHTYTCETTARSQQVQQPLSASQTPAEEGEGCPRAAGRRGLPCREPRTSRFQGYTQ